jgi:hypothetical protein
VKYSFEDGTVDGWSSTGHVTSLTNSSDVGGADGSHALKVVFDSTSSSDYPYIHVNPSSGPVAGQTVSAYIYVPSSSTTVIAKLYVEDSSFTWHQENAVTVSTTGSWFELSFTPTGYSGNALQIGIQFNETPLSTATTVYVDAIGWS